MRRKTKQKIIKPELKIQYEAQYLYKCRNCGKIFIGCYSAPERALYNLIDAIHKVYILYV